MAAERSPILSEVRATLGIAAPLAAANLAQMAMGNDQHDHGRRARRRAARRRRARRDAVLYDGDAVPGVLSAVAPLAAHAIGADDHPTAGRVAGAGLIVAAALALPIDRDPDRDSARCSPASATSPALAAEIGNYLRMIRWGAPAFLGFAVLRFLLVAAFRTRIVMLVPLLRSRSTRR